jgi:hypothetical protein
MSPISVHYEIGLTGVTSQKRSPVFMLCICDNHAEDFLACQGFGSLFVRDKATNNYKSDAIASSRPVQEGLVYQLDLALKETKATTKCDGTDVKALDAIPRRNGETFFWVDSEAPVLLHKLVIEGAPSLEVLKKKWLDHEIAVLGCERVRSSTELGASTLRVTREKRRSRRCARAARS